MCCRLPIWMCVQSSSMVMKLIYVMVRVLIAIALLTLFSISTTASEPSFKGFTADMSHETFIKIVKSHGGICILDCKEATFKDFTLGGAKIFSADWRQSIDFRRIALGTRADSGARLAKSLDEKLGEPTSQTEEAHTKNSRWEYQDQKSVRYRLNTVFDQGSLILVFDTPYEEPDLAGGYDSSDF